MPTSLGDMVSTISRLVIAGADLFFLKKKHACPFVGIEVLGLEHESFWSAWSSPSSLWSLP